MGDSKQFQSKIVIVTGGAAGIGQCICQAFAQAGAIVCPIDQQDNPYFVGDIGKKATLEAFVQQVIQEHGRVDYLIHNAPPPMIGLEDCSYEQFQQAMDIGVTAPFYLTKLCLPYFAPGAAIVQISSSRDRMSQPQTESYTAAKGGISALTHSLAVSLSGRVRVNAISPGWIETGRQTYQGADASQHPAGRVGRPEDIAHMTLFLCSEQAGFITGENICIDGGMTHQMIYHNDHHWRLGATDD